MKKISVIVPIYNVESYIEHCVRSLLGQTLEDVEFIFVDDCSPDNSLSILQGVLKEYPSRCEAVHIINHKENLGLPSARNSGLAVASAEYIFHCDSDDFVDPNMLAELYYEAKKEDADIVWCDWWLSFAKNERYMKQPEYATAEDALKGLLQGTMKFNVWNKLVRRSLYVDYDIHFPSGYGMGEDMTMIRLFARARKVAYLPKAFYHYVQLNSGAFCKTENKRYFTDIKHNVSVVEKDLIGMFANQLDKEIAFFKLNVKFPFLIGCDVEKYRLWGDWYPEANKYIFKNKSVSFRSRLLQFAAWKKQYWFLKLYYLCIHRFVYGVIYR